LESLGAVLPLVLLAVLGYVLLIRPTRRRAQEVQAVQSQLAVDAEVMLTSGFFGQVRGIDGEQVKVEISPGVVVTVHRGAIGRVLTPADVLDDQDDADADHDPDADAGHDPRGAN
jgi:preprotein translocase subunit YajC